MKKIKIFHRCCWNVTQLTKQELEVTHGMSTREAFFEKNIFAHCVTFVAQTSLILQIIIVLTRERNLFCVHTVHTRQVTKQTLGNICVFTLEKNLLLVLTVLTKQIKIMPSNIIWKLTFQLLNFFKQICTVFGFLNQCAKNDMVSSQLRWYVSDIDDFEIHLLSTVSWNFQCWYAEFFLHQNF